MASRSHSWFDEAKLLPGERLVRSGPALLGVPRPPYWWDGELYLTTDRLFFIPTVDHERLDEAAFWLCDLAAAPSRRHQLAVSAPGQHATFDFSAAAAALVRDRAAPWRRAIAAARPDARSRRAFEPPARRRAAG